MPEMSDDQMARLIKELSTVVLLNGFGAFIEVSGGQPRDVDVVLDKPVTLGVLRQTIDSLLNAA